MTSDELEYQLNFNFRFWAIYANDIFGIGWVKTVFSLYIHLLHIRITPASRDYMTDLLSAFSEKNHIHNTDNIIANWTEALLHKNNTQQWHEMANN